MLIKTLQNLGLTDKEAKIYLANLEIGTNPVSEIGKKAKINRVTTYDILEKLVKKGMVNYIIKRDIKYFSAIDPELVANEFKRRAGELYDVLPELKRLHGETSQPKVQHFEGLEGVKNIYIQLLAEMKRNIDAAEDNPSTRKLEDMQILNFSNYGIIKRLWPAYDEEVIHKRTNISIITKCINPDDEQGNTLKSKDKQYLRETRLVSIEKYDFNNEILIYGNKVAIISFKENATGVMIEDAEIAETQRTIFNMVWEFAEITNSTIILPKGAPGMMNIPTENSAQTTNSPQINPEMTIRKVGSIKTREEAILLENQSSLF